MTGRPAFVVALVFLLLTAGCSSDDGKPAPTPTARPSAQPDDCPATYAAPDGNRPRITLQFSVSADRRTVTGTEDVLFIPDRPVTELVFRLWPNGPSASPGTGLQVTAVKAGTVTTFRTEPGGGRPGTQGTVLRIPLGRTVAAGEQVTASVQFRLGLGPAIYERWGRTAATAWWGTGHPLLAWVRGAGWQTTPAGTVGGEYAASETARYEVTVDAPEADTVLGSGVVDDPMAAGPGRRRWRLVNTTARDIAVVVGDLRLTQDQVAGIPATIAVASDSATRPDELRGDVANAVPRLERLLGPYPFRSLTVVSVPGMGGGGIEFPGMFFVGPRAGLTTVTHEAAHQWFYGLLGDDQATHPWLDEAFAQYAQTLVDGRTDPDRRLLASSGRVDSPTASFGPDEDAYGRVVYGKGAEALLAARQAAGGARFDRALRCHLNARAWRVVTPGDVAMALSGLPAARAELTKAGAL